MRNITSYPSLSKENSLWKWHKIKNPLRVSMNYFVMKTCRWLPSLRMKNSLYRMIGVKVGEHVSFGLESTVDIFFPELIEIGDNTIIGYNCTLIAHEFLTNEYRIGKIKIGKNVVIGANTTVLAGITIADNTVVSACSLVNRDVSGFVGGIPVRELKKEELNEGSQPNHKLL